MECLPLKTLEEVLAWKPKTLKFCSEKLQERVCNKDRPRTLVCHDMKGGYREDRFVQGVEKNDCFSFIHWSLVDIFIYFSHHLVTIPPCGWITAAHRSGTHMLGTFITEWSDGAQICENFLKDSESVHELCDRLVDLSSFYGFDGWLINIENKIQADHVEHLEEFVRVLTAKQHLAKSNSLVIWYDSVIKTGELKWQNCLNENNKNFFMGCDGIFLNYTWKNEHLQKSIIEAGSRKHDVYVGVDVFGRGCLGNGGFCTNVAVKVARDHGLSVAIFAPGWLYECLEVRDFWENQYKFWDLLTELCYPLSYKSLPFSTSFCPGFGKHMFRQGKVIGKKTWFNLSLQQPQPTYHYMQASPHEGCTTVCIDEAYSGGGCLKLRGVYKKSVPQIFGIFKCCFELEQSCIITYTFKPVFPQGADVTLVLNILSAGNSYCLHLAGKAEDDKGDDQLEGSPHSDQVHGHLPKTVYPAKEMELLGILNGSVPPPSEGDGWITRTYILPISNFIHHVIEGVDACISCPSTNDGSHYSILLGNFVILPVDAGALHMSCTDVWQSVIHDRIRLHCFLEWTPKTSVHSWDLFYDLCDEHHYLGSTVQPFYEVSDLPINKESYASGVKPAIKFSLCGQSIYGVLVETHSITVPLPTVNDAPSVS